VRALLSVLKAVADKNRVRIIKMLEQKPMCCCEMAAVLGITQPSVSKHLSILKNAGLITDERNGQWIDYSLSKENINEYAPVIQAHLRQWVNEDTAIVRDRKKISTVKREEICKR